MNRDELIEKAVANIRDWLHQQTDIIETFTPHPTEEPIGLTDLFGQLLGLKQEVHLLTKTTRLALEQNSQLIQDRPNVSEADSTSVIDIKEWFEIYDALAQSMKQLERLKSEALQSQTQIPQAKRWFFQRSTHQIPAPSPLLMMESMLQGYQLSLSRIERQFNKMGYHGIQCIGKPFNPEEMEALDLVAEPNSISGNVIEEIRRGYRHEGRIIRYALVRVAK